MIKTPIKKGFEMNYLGNSQAKTIKTAATPKTHDQTDGRSATDENLTKLLS
jgi:hypothetical protein